MYTITRGSTRVVVTLPSWGIVIKIPNVEVGYGTMRKFKETVDMFRSFWPDIRRLPYGNRRFFRYVIVDAFRIFSSTLRGFCSGVAANWRERRYSFRATCLELMLIEQTYFSLFGLINVHHYGEPSKADKEIVRYLFGTLTKGASRRGTHTFQNPANFTGLEKGYIKALDYADPIVQRVLSEHAVRLLRRVDLNEARKWYELRNTKGRPYLP